MKQIIISVIFLFLTSSLYAQPENGIHREFYDDGTLRSIAYYKDGQLNGMVKLFHENGNLKVECYFKNGKLDGPASTYSKDGKLQGSGEFIDGICEECYEYFSTGRLKEISRFVGDQRSGPFKQYNIKGKLKASGEYQDNKVISKIIYDEEGQITSQGELKNP